MMLQNVLPAKEIEDRFQRSFFGSSFPRTLSGATVKCPIRGMIRVFRMDSDACRSFFGKEET